MFDELDKQNTVPHPNPLLGKEREPNAPVPAKAQDIFSEVDKTVKPEPLRPRNNSLPAAGTVVPADDSWLKNKGLIVGLVLGGLIIVVGGGYLGLKYAVKGAVKIKKTPTETSNLTESAPAQETAAPLSQPTEPLKVTQPVDSDQDGLTDEEEAKLGLDANNSDTDQDDLTDREETKVYGTDPLKADTDGDGYADGEEIKNGFNPKGSGKLLDINNQ